MRKSIPILVLLAACVPLTEENAPERFAQVTCRKMSQCDDDAYDNLYDGEFSECVDEQTDAYEIILDVTGVFGLDLDLDELRRCMRDVRAASCDEYDAGDFGNDCDDVFTF